MSDVRYKISYGDNSVSFSAPMANSNEELARVLVDIADGLKAPSKKVIAECDNCFKFILEGDEVNIIEEETLCNDCWNK